MQTFYVTDNKGLEHTYLMVHIAESYFAELKGLFPKFYPIAIFSPILYESKPVIVLRFDFSNELVSTASLKIPLNETFNSGKQLGEQFSIGETITLCLISDKEEERIVECLSKEVLFKVHLDNIIVLSFTYTKEMEAVYFFYRVYVDSKAKQFGLIGREGIDAK